jgi:hypothetical protein
MKSLLDYGNHFLNELLEMRISLLEGALLVALLLMCLVSAIECNLGRDVGSIEQIRMARQQAQQEWMALRSPDRPN